jgi:hypothetical protein
VSTALVPVAAMAAAATAVLPLWPANAAAHTPRHTEEARIAEWPPAQLRPTQVPRTAAPAPAPTPRKTRQPRHPAAGLSALLLFGLLAAFLGWTSAEPFWLAVGHAEAGTATVQRCTGGGVLRRCVVTFDGASFTAENATLAGASRRAMVDGAKLSTRMVNAHSRMAYAGSRDGLGVRLGVGLALILLCGIAIVWLGGARRLPGRHARLGATLLSLAAPFVLFAGMLAATF